MQCQICTTPREINNEEQHKEEVRQFLLDIDPKCCKLYYALFIEHALDRMDNIMGIQRIDLREMKIPTGWIRRILDKIKERAIKERSKTNHNDHIKQENEDSDDDVEILHNTPSKSDTTSNNNIDNIIGKKEDKNLSRSLPPTLINIKTKD